MSSLLESAGFVLAACIVGVGDRPRHAKHALKMLRRPVDSCRRPLDVSVRRRVRNDVPPRRVRPVLFDQVFRIDDVLFGFRHFGGRDDFDRLVRLLENRPVGSDLDVRREMVDGPPRPVPGHVDFVRHHPLREQGVERLDRFFGEMAGQGHGAREKPRIKQVQDGMLNPADVLVHVHPVIGFVAHGRGFRSRGRKPYEIPGAVHEGIHRVGFPQCGSAALGTLAASPFVVAGERIARNAEIGFLRKNDRKVLLPLRDNSARVAVHDGDGTAPVSLAAKAPIAKPVLRYALPHSGLFAMVDRRVDRFRSGLEFAARDRANIPDLLFLGRHEGRIRDRRAVFGGLEDVDHAEIVFPRELQISLIVGRTAEYRPRSVIHQYEIRDPDGKLHAFVERMLHSNRCRDSDLFGRLQFRFRQSG